MTAKHLLRSLQSATAPQQVRLAIQAGLEARRAGPTHVTALVSALLAQQNDAAARHAACVLVEAHFPDVLRATVMELALSPALPPREHRIVLRAVARFGDADMARQLLHFSDASAATRSALLHLLLRFGRHVDALLDDVRASMGSAALARALPRCAPEAVARLVPELWDEPAMKWARLCRHHGATLVALLARDLEDPAARSLGSPGNVWAFWDRKLHATTLMRDSGESAALVALLQAHPPPADALPRLVTECVPFLARKHPAFFVATLKQSRAFRALRAWHADKRALAAAAAHAAELLPLVLDDARQLGVVFFASDAPLAAVLRAAPLFDYVVGDKSTVAMHAPLAEALGSCELATASLRAVGLAHAPDDLHRLAAMAEPEAVAALLADGDCFPRLDREGRHDVLLQLLTYAPPEAAAAAVEAVTRQLQGGVASHELLRVDLLEHLDVADPNARHLLELASFNTDDAVRVRALLCLLRSSVRAGAVREMDVTVEFLLRRVRNERADAVANVLNHFHVLVPGSLLSPASLKLFADIVDYSTAWVVSQIAARAFAASAGEIEGPTWQASMELMSVVHRLQMPNGGHFQFLASPYQPLDVPDELVAAFAQAFVARRDTFQPPPGLDLFRRGAHWRRAAWFVATLQLLPRQWYASPELRAEAREFVWSWGATLRGLSHFQHAVAQRFLDELSLVQPASELLERRWADLAADAQLLVDSSAYGARAVNCVALVAAATGHAWATHANSWMRDALRPALYSKSAAYSSVTYLWQNVPEAVVPQCGPEFAKDLRMLALRRGLAPMLDRYLAAPDTRDARAADVLRKADWRQSRRLGRHVLHRAPPDALLRELRGARSHADAAQVLAKYIYQMQPSVWRRAPLQQLAPVVVAALRAKLEDAVARQQGGDHTYVAMLGRLPGVRAADVRALAAAARERLMEDASAPSNALALRALRRAELRALAGLPRADEAFDELLGALADLGTDEDASGDEHLAVAELLPRAVARVPAATAVPALLALLEGHGAHKMVLRKAVMRALVHFGTADALQAVADAQSSPDVACAVLQVLPQALRRGDSAAACWRLVAGAVEGGERQQQLALVAAAKGVAALPAGARRRFAVEALLPLLAGSAHNDVLLGAAGALSRALGLGVDAQIAAALASFMRGVVRDSNESAYADKQWAAGAMTLLRACCAAPNGWVGARDGDCEDELLRLVEDLARDWRDAVARLLDSRSPAAWAAQRGIDARLAHLLDAVPRSLSADGEARLLRAMEATEHHHARVLARRLLGAASLREQLVAAAAEITERPSLAAPFADAAAIVVAALPPTADSHLELLRGAAAMAEAGAAAAAVRLVDACSALPAHAGTAEARREFIMQLARHEDSCIRSAALRVG